MSLPIRPLPIVERWDCSGCGRCCRGTIVTLTAADVARLRDQRWHEHPEFRGQRIVQRHGWRRPSWTLAKRPDGACIFLGADNLCRIHKELGLHAKPVVCQTFPLQLVPLESEALLTLRRYCPTVAADRGRPAGEYLPEARRLGELAGKLDQPGVAPPVTRDYPGGWPDVLAVAAIFERFLLDARYPPVRRLAHGLAFCDLLERCRLSQLVPERIGELLPILADAAIGEAQAWFAARRPAGRAGRLLFRQVALEYLTLHPQYRARASWGARWRMARLAAAFAWGRGPIPALNDFPPATFAALEGPLGALEPDVLRPLTAYFEAGGASKQYLLLGRGGWNVVECFRALTFAYPVALWLVRLAAGGDPPQVAHVLDAVAAIDRAQGSAPLTGARHRRRLRSLVRLKDLPRLLVWYAR